MNVRRLFASLVISLMAVACTIGFVYIGWLLALLIGALILLGEPHAWRAVTFVRVPVWVRKRRTLLALFTILIGEVIYALMSSLQVVGAGTIVAPLLVGEFALSASAAYALSGPKPERTGTIAVPPPTLEDFALVRGKLEDFVAQLHDNHVHDSVETIESLRQRRIELSALRNRVRQLAQESSKLCTLRSFTSANGTLPGLGRYILRTFSISLARSRGERSLDRLQRSIDEALLALADPELATVELRRAFSGRPNEVSIRVAEAVAYLEMSAPPDRVSRLEKVQVRRGKQVKVVTRARPITDVNFEYRIQVAEFARQTIHQAFRAVPGLEAVVVSLFVPMRHVTLGHDYRGCVLSVRADHGTWERIIHKNVSAENCLANFPLRYLVGPRGDLSEVKPLIRPAVPGSTSSVAIDLNSIDPLRFEVLVRDLLQSMGYEATLTKASHDGGIDVEAVNPEPIIGGKVVVQCKRYSSTISAAIVRELYGALTDSRATIGILVTTSDFSPDARAFAENKPIELINGKTLSDLLKRYGLSVA